MKVLWKFGHIRYVTRANDATLYRFWTTRIKCKDDILLAGPIQIHRPGTKTARPEACTVIPERLCMQLNLQIVFRYHEDGSKKLNACLLFRTVTVEAAYRR